LAGRGTDQARELGEVVGRMESIDSIAPVARACEIVPVWDQVAKRAGVVAEGHSAIHAASSLRSQFRLRKRAVDLVVVVDAFGGFAHGVRHSSCFEESAWISHRTSLPNASSAPSTQTDRSSS